MVSWVLSSQFDLLNHTWCASRRSALFVGHATTSSRTPGCADHICNQSIDCTASCVLAENMLLLLHSLSWSILVLPMGKNCCMLNTHICSNNSSNIWNKKSLHLSAERKNMVGSRKVLDYTYNSSNNVSSDLSGENILPLKLIIIREKFL